MKLFFSQLCLVLLLAWSCTNTIDVMEGDEDGQSNVTVCVNDFSITMDAFTRAATDVAEYSGVKAITLAFYASDGTEVYKATQLRADASTYTTFGNFSTSLALGEYTMVVLGYGSLYAITLTSPTYAAYTDDNCRETFVYTRSVTINSTADTNLDATLTRRVSKLSVRSTDPLPANVKKGSITYSAGGKTFNPTTGLSTGTGLVHSFDFTSTVGSTASIGSYLFLNTDEQNINVTIRIMDADENVLYSANVNDVPFKRNRTTTIQGKLFSTSASSAFSVEAAWLEDGPVIGI